MAVMDQITQLGTVNSCQKPRANPLKVTQPDMAKGSVTRVGDSTVITILKAKSNTMNVGKRANSKIPSHTRFHKNQVHAKGMYRKKKSMFSGTRQIVHTNIDNGQMFQMMETSGWWEEIMLSNIFFISYYFCFLFIFIINKQIKI